MNILSKIMGGNTLFYPGCLTKFAAKELLENYKKILALEGVDFVTLADNEVCCGSPLKNAGAKNTFHDLAKKNLEIFKNHSIDQIISNCPSCVAMFKIDYQEILGKAWNIEVKHVVEIMDKSLSKLEKVQNKTATYHDPCHLGRVLGIYEKPRKIIKQAGFKLLEMDLHGEFSFCCGAGGGVKSNEEELSNKIATDRIDQAKTVGADVLITACPMCYAHLKQNKDNLNVMEMSQMFDLE